MAKKIIVQGGIVSYSNSDPALDLNLNVAGIVNVTKELNVGDEPLTGGTLTTPPGQDLHVMAGNTGAFKVETLGPIILNNVVWPQGPQNITQGSFLGASGLNTLAFYPFVLAFNGSDTLTPSQLNTAYPTAQPGQSVVGPTVIYECVSPGDWRTLGAGGGGGGLSFPLMAPSAALEYSFAAAPTTGIGWFESLFDYNRLSIEAQGTFTADAIPSSVDSYSGSAIVNVDGLNYYALGSGYSAFGPTIKTNSNTDVIASTGIIQFSNGNAQGQTADSSPYSLTGSQFRIESNVYTRSTDTLSAGGFVLSVQDPIRTDGGPTATGGLTFVNGSADTVGSVVFSFGVITGSGSAKSVEFAADGSIGFTSAFGTAGQVLTSAGPGNAVSWQTPGGGTTPLVVTLAPTGYSYFDGIVATNWSANVYLNSPNVGWDTGTQQLLFAVTGVYKITIQAQQQASFPSYWPDNLTQFGTQLYGFNTIGASNSRHSTWTGNIPNNFRGIELNLANTPQPEVAIYTDEYLINISSPGTYQPIGLYAANYTSQFTGWSGQLAVTVEFLG